MGIGVTFNSSLYGSISCQLNKLGIDYVRSVGKYILGASFTFDVRPLPLWVRYPLLEQSELTGLSSSKIRDALVFGAKGIVSRRRHHDDHRRRSSKMNIALNVKRPKG